MPRFPVCIQHDAMDCGPATVKMIAKYYGKEYSLEELRELSYTSKDGVSLLSISDTAEHIGFKTIGGRLTPQQIFDQVPLPCIVHWDQEHFVVLYKVTKKKVYIADPGFGLRNFSKAEYKKHWLSTRKEGEEKGLALLLEPTQAFYSKEPEKRDSKSLTFLFKYFIKYKRYFGQLLLGLFLASLFQLVFPFLTQSIIDIGIKSKNINFIYLVLLAQMVLVLSRMSVTFIRRWILLHISTRINVSLISDFFIKLMKLPMSYFDSKLTGDLLQRIEDHRRVEGFLTARTLDTVFSFFTLVVFGAVLWFYSIKIFIVFFIGSLVYAGWLTFFLKKRREIDFQYFEARSTNQSKTYQLIHGMQEIKLQNYETLKRWEWEDIQADLFKVNISALKLEQIQESGNILINESKNIVITIIAALAVINGEMTLGMMLATQYIIGQLTLPIDQSADFIHDLQDTKISLERINEVHQRKDENADKKKTISQLQSRAIEIKNLTFQYEGPHSKKVLDKINLIIPEGKTTAIVGASGSGKTTLIKLLLQYYSPVEGTITIGNINLNTLDTVWWRKQCGTVMQDGYIFSESIAQNVSMSSLSEVDTIKLKNAAKIANIHDFINELPLKYNTIIGQEGQNLSQGQRQRLLIARAIYKNPDFLFFDEATNALDANNEKTIVENLQQFYKGKTVLVVAHRLSTVKNADQIVVLENGNIVEIGDHKKLTGLKGVYYQLVKNQLELGN